jgi:hypothetical protein
MIGSLMLSALSSERSAADELLRGEIGRKTADWGTPHSNQSLLGAVSFPGNGILRPETKVPKSPSDLMRPLAETRRPNASRQCGGFRQKPGKSLLDRTAWWGWEDSNYVTRTRSCRTQCGRKQHDTTFSAVP